MTRNAAFVTLLTKSEYLPGALVLHWSLCEVNAMYPLVVMVTPTVPEVVRSVLHKRGIRTRDIESLIPQGVVQSHAPEFARFKDTWTKLRVFQLAEYDRAVLLDSDMLVLKNIDDLMELDIPPDSIAAAHACACNPRKYSQYPKDWIPANCAHSSVNHPNALTNPPQIKPDSPRLYRLLNSGLVVTRPSTDLFESIKHFLDTCPDVSSFSFPDQDLLAAYFKGRWKVLPWCYNALKTLRVVHTGLWRDEEVKVLHYILHDKPWQGRHTTEDYQVLNEWWWKRFDDLHREMEKADPAGWALVKQHVSE